MSTGMNTILRQETAARRVRAMSPSFVILLIYLPTSIILTQNVNVMLNRYHMELLWLKAIISSHPTASGESSGSGLHTSYPASSPHHLLQRRLPGFLFIPCQKNRPSHSILFMILIQPLLSHTIALSILRLYVRIR